MKVFVVLLLRCLLGDGPQDAGEGLAKGVGVFHNLVHVHAGADEDEEDRDEAHGQARQELVDGDPLALLPAGQEVEERRKPEGGWADADGGDQALEVAEERHRVGDQPSEGDGAARDCEPLEPLRLVLGVHAARPQPNLDGAGQQLGVEAEGHEDVQEHADGCHCLDRPVAHVEENVLVGLVPVPKVEAERGPKVERDDDGHEDRQGLWEVLGVPHLGHGLEVHALSAVRKDQGGHRREGAEESLGSLLHGQRVVLDALRADLVPRGVGLDQQKQDGDRNHQHAEGARVGDLMKSAELAQGHDKREGGQGGVVQADVLHPERNLYGLGRRQQVVGHLHEEVGVHDDEGQPHECLAGNALGDVAVGHAVMIGHVQAPQQQSRVRGEQTESGEDDHAHGPAHPVEGLRQVDDARADQVGHDDEDDVHPPGDAVGRGVAPPRNVARRGESLDVDLLAALAAVVDRLHLLQRRLHDHSVRRVGLWVARSLVRVHRDGAVFGLILSSFVFEVT
mmetsp:Transcript_3227/g.11252  ORF Transcript_3227/g.11252 Transcript_3227/m.11252 type:complete len:508 (-) Transcript_3227:129-1652(-)